MILLKDSKEELLKLYKDHLHEWNKHLKIYSLPSAYKSNSMSVKIPQLSIFQRSASSSKNSYGRAKPKQSTKFRKLAR